MKKSLCSTVYLSKHGCFSRYKWCADWFPCTQMTKLVETLTNRDDMLRDIFLGLIQAISRKAGERTSAQRAFSSTL